MAARWCTMYAIVALLLLSALNWAKAVRDDERTFAMIAAANATGQWKMKLATGNKRLPNMGFVNVNCSYNTVDSPCAAINPPLKQDVGDLLRITYTLAAPKGPNASLATFSGEAPTHLEARICYSLGSSVDRAWRKKNKAYPRLSQNCPRTAGKADFAGPVSPANLSANSGEFIMDFDQEDEIPKAAWFAMIWVYCGEHVCAFETTESGPQKNYFETDVTNGVTPGMRAAAIILSIFSPVFLIVYMIADHFHYQKTGRALTF